MKLRYAGTCRLCGTPLAAGSPAVYERSRRTVRCIECPGFAAQPSAGSVVESKPQERPAPAELRPPADPDGLRLRAPASAVIAETLRAQAAATPRSRAARLFGVSPLSADALPWYRGAIGELEVARLLDRLGPGWTAIHAIPVGKAGSDIDHLVIGPGGLFTINSKYHEDKRIWVGAKRLMVNGQRTDHLRNAAYEAKRVARTMSSAARTAVDVTPVVAIVGARGITMRERPKDVAVLSARHLVAWLCRRPRVLDEGEVNALTRIVLDPTTWGSPALPEADLSGFAALRESVASARRRQRGWALVTILASLALLATVFTSFPAALLALFL